MFVGFRAAYCRLSSWLPHLHYNERFGNMLDCPTGLFNYINMPPLRQFDQEDYAALPLALVGLLLEKALGGSDSLS